MKIGSQIVFQVNYLFLIIYSIYIILNNIYLFDMIQLSIQYIYNFNNIYKIYFLFLILILFF